MIKHKIKAFTLIEIIIAVAIIGVLFMATTVYLGGTDQKRKVIEAQGCTATLQGEISNYVFYALTSKNLKIEDKGKTKMVTPDYYYIQLTGGTNNCPAGSFCGITLSYTTPENSTKAVYKTLTSNNTCRGNNPRLTYSRTGTSNFSYVKMNKGFTESPENPNDTRVFGLDGGALLGDIIVSLCLNSECSNPRQISKFAVDGRSQTISLVHCKYYENDPNICKTWENCKVYDNNDTSRCKEY